MTLKCATTTLVQHHRDVAVSSVNFTLKALIAIGLIAGACLLSGALLASRIERAVENTEAKDAAIHCRRFTSWWSGGARSWPKSLHYSMKYSMTFRNRVPPPVRS